MGNKAIFRSALKAKRSTYNHIVNTQSVYNQDPEKNPNVNNSNVLIITDDKNKLIKRSYKRDGSHQNLIDMLNDKEKQLDELARADYTAFKKEQKAQNPTQKIRTVLQSKDLKREFVIAVGGDKNITDKAKFEADIIKSALAVLEKKGLDQRNIICISVQFDEKTPHAHILYNDYSYKHHTTGDEFIKTRYKPGMDKKEIRALNRAKFSEFQDIVADKMGMERGQRGSKAQHRETYEFYEEQAPKIKQKLDNLKISYKVRSQTIEKQKNEIAKNREIIANQQKIIDKNSEKINGSNLFDGLAANFERMPENAKKHTLTILENATKTFKDNDMPDHSAFFDSFKKMLENFMIFQNGLKYRERKKSQSFQQVSKNKEQPQR